MPVNPSRVRFSNLLTVSLRVGYSALKDTVKDDIYPWKRFATGTPGSDCVCMLACTHAQLASQVTCASEDLLSDKEEQYGANDGSNTNEEEDGSGCRICCNREQLLAASHGQATKVTVNCFPVCKITSAVMISGTENM